jgi:N-acyl amino acid synthase of PEP-CTERM/exosortase system
VHARFSRIVDFGQSMNSGIDFPSERNLSALYDRDFIVVPADTPDLMDAAHALRYQVYCVEHQFEDPAQQQGKRERDAYDAHSVHAVLIARSSGDVVGCVRLILPDGATPSLPLWNLLGDPERSRLDSFGRHRTAEISRYAIAKAYRRREGESQYPDVGEPVANELRRLVPHMSLGLLRGVGRLAARNGMETVCAAMAPSLMRLLERFGLVFERLGSPVDCHGTRQPCVGECEQLLAGMADRNSDYFRLVERAYHAPDDAS